MAASKRPDLRRNGGVPSRGDLIDRLEPPPGIAKRSLGDLRLRGKEKDVALYALTGAVVEADQSIVRRISALSGIMSHEIGGPQLLPRKSEL